MLSIDKIIPLLGIMSITIYSSLLLEKQHTILKGPGSALITLLIAGFLAKMGIVPSEHIFYAQVFTWGIPLALASSLITSCPMGNSRIRAIFIKGLLLGLSVLILVGTLGAIILCYIGAPGYPDASAYDKLDLLYTLITPKTLSQLPREGYSLFAVLGNSLLPFTLILGSIIPILLRGFYPSIWTNIPISEERLYSMEEKGYIYLERPGTSLENLTILLALSLFCVSIAEGLSIIYPQIPFLVVLAMAALIIGRFVPRHCLEVPSNLIARFIIHLHFFAAGTLIGNTQFLRLAGPMTILAGALMILEILILFLAGRILKIDIETLTVISQVLTGGPYSGYSISLVKKWQPLYWVALISGIINYSFIGIIRNIFSTI